MTRLHYFGLFFCLIHLFSSCSTPVPPWHSNWATQADRVWIGHDLWANRLQDWRISAEMAECTHLYPLRTLHLLTAEWSPRSGEGFMEVSIEFAGIAPENRDSVSAGFLIGAGAGLDYRAAALIHHSLGPQAGLFAGINANGLVFLRDLETGRQLSALAFRKEPSYTLRLEVTERKGKATLRLFARTEAPDEQETELRVNDLPAERINGHLALVADGRRPALPGQIRFGVWHAGGDKLSRYPERRCGPVIATQYTLDHRQLKLSAQFMPIGPTDNHEAELQVSYDGRWSTVATAEIIEPGFTALFRVNDWADSLDRPVRVVYHDRVDGEAHYYEGTVRRQPLDRDTFTLAAFTGNHNVVRPDPERWGGVDVGQFPWDWGLWFPHTELVAHVREQQPDLLFFSGDQVYESASPTWADVEDPYLDYLYKWYLWCWAYGPLTAEMPAVTIPDDHDVFHGNIWGAGGAATPPGLTGAAAQDKGGYKLPAEWVNMVHRTQTSHLPDPVDPVPVGVGITNYFTALTYGGISFAILEDRKFKSAPVPLLPAAQIINGWAQNPSFDPRRQADPPGAQLLGPAQEAFLAAWAADWSGHAEWKVALSQTIFANLATLPAGSRSDAVVATLPILAEGDYPPDDQPVADMDSNGWPPSGRNRALRLLRKGFALHVAGDQHLGSTIQYGVDQWGDAGYALCVPSIANFWARRWMPATPGEHRRPGSPRYTGDYLDGFGNHMTVFAVANPQQRGHEPAERHDKAAGYGIVRLDKAGRRASLENWPIWSSPAEGGRPYPGWPVVVDQRQNYGRTPTAWLPELRIEGMAQPVVQVSVEKTGELVYALRLSDPVFQPGVFAPGTYRVRVGDPDAGTWQEVELEAGTGKDGIHVMRF